MYSCTLTKDSEFHLSINVDIEIPVNDDLEFFSTGVDYCNG